MSVEQRALFPPELRTVSRVPRWSILWKLQDDSLTTHSFFVAFYARQIAKLIDWKGNIGDLMFVALCDDLDETITGDIVGPAKHEIIDRARYDAYITKMMERRMPVVDMEYNNILARSEHTEDKGLREIVKVADIMDSLIFLIFEVRLGNAIVEKSHRIDKGFKDLEAAWYKLPAHRDDLHRLWGNVIRQAVWNHATSGGSGI